MEFNLHTNSYGKYCACITEVVHLPKLVLVKNERETSPKMREKATLKDESSVHSPSISLLQAQNIS